MHQRTQNPLPDGRGSIITRRGGAATGLIATLVILAGLTTVTVMFGPKFAGADVGSAPASGAAPKTISERQLVCNGLASLLGSSHQVLAIHVRGPSPYVEFVLWVDDRHNRGQIDPGEVAVVAHSRVLQTVTWFSLTPGDRNIEQWDALGQEVLVAERVDAPGFCDRWRSHHAVAPRVIGTGISDLRVNIAQQVNSETAVVQITLKWPVDSTDSPTETSAQVHVALRAATKRSTTQ